MGELATNNSALQEKMKEMASANIALQSRVTQEKRNFKFSDLI